MAPPIRTTTSFPLSLSLPSGSFHKPLILFHQRADRKSALRFFSKIVKITITEILTNLITWTAALSNSMKLWAIPNRATQDEQVMVESSDKMLSTGEGKGKLLQYSCLENPMNSTKRQKDRTLKDELPRLVGAQYATGEVWRNKSCECDWWWK